MIPGMWQNQASVYNLDFFLPRGQEDTLLGSGAFVKFGADLVQPIAYIDNGALTIECSWLGAGVRKKGGTSLGLVLCRPMSRRLM